MTRTRTPTPQKQAATRACSGPTSPADRGGFSFPHFRHAAARLRPGDHLENGGLEGYPGTLGAKLEQRVRRAFDSRAMIGSRRPQWLARVLGRVPSLARAGTP